MQLEALSKIQDQARQNNLRHRLPNDTWLVQARIDISIAYRYLTAF